MHLESFEGCQGSQGHILLHGDRGVSKENVLASIWLVDQVSGEFVEPPSVQIIGHGLTCKVPRITFSMFTHDSLHQSIV